MGSTPQVMDLSHHINAKSKARHSSPLKDMITLMGQEGMISLAGGLPHPSLFPITDITFTASTTDDERDSRTEIKLSQDSTVPLSQWLQYGSGAGNAELRKWCHDFTTRVHQPAYPDFEILCNSGNTNAWSKVVGLLLEDEDYILCENFTYPSAQALWIPLGNHAAPVALDDQGMRADLLEETLINWESTHPGKRRPHVMYVVPIGSNPTGITYSAKRKKEIYSICVKYDIIIVEDDPYFFLQFPPPSPSGETSQEVVANETFLDSLSPSFLRYDYQGRVIRLESFSKTLAPGLRLGYFIANPIFTERLLRALEVDTQDPSGLSQAFVLSMLHSWGHEGFVRWMQTIRCEYQRRRDWMVAAFSSHFELVPADMCPDLPGEQGLVALLKRGDDTKKPVPVFSFVPPTAGMFIWAKFYLASNPNFSKLLMQGNTLDPEQTFADQLWREFSKDLVLLTPGSYYHPWEGKAKTTTKTRGDRIAHFRFSFSMTTKSDMETGIERFAQVVRKSWGLGGGN